MERGRVLTASTETPQSTKLLAKRREDNKLDKAASDTIDREDGSDGIGFNAEPTGEEERQPRVLRRVLHRRIVEEHGQDLIIRHRMQS